MKKIIGIVMVLVLCGGNVWGQEILKALEEFVSMNTSNSDAPDGNNTDAATPEDTVSNEKFQEVIEKIIMPDFSKIDVKSKYSLDWDYLVDTNKRVSLKNMFPYSYLGTEERKFSDKNTQKKYVMRKILEPVMESKGETLTVGLKDEELIKMIEGLIIERQSSFRTWYTSENRTQSFNESTPIDPNLQEIILDYFIADTPTDDEIATAKALLNLLQSMGIKALNETDCEKRPWYVAGCFFEFMNKYKGQSQFIRKPQLIVRSVFQNTTYTTTVKNYLFNWLTTEFAYDAESLKNKNVGQLAKLLKEQLAGVKPYHRYVQKHCDTQKEKHLEYFLKINP